MQQSLFFLLYYATVLILGAVLIVGWFAVTRGQWYKNPDDTPYWSGKLFSPWLRFWTQETGKERYFYKGGELDQIVMKITDLLGVKDYGVDNSYLRVGTANRDMLLWRKSYIFHHLGVRIEKASNGEDDLLMIYKEYPTYKFPHWVRDPLASCIYCHGSVYGTLIWWLTAGLLKANLDLPFSWLLIAVFWLPFIVSQSFLSAYLNKKL